MIKLFLKEPGYFRKKPITGLPENYYINTESKGDNTKCIQLLKNNMKILHVTHTRIDFKGTHFKGDIFNGGIFFKEDSYKYHKDDIDIKFVKLPNTQCAFQSNPIYILGYINDKRIVFARTGVGVSDFFEPTLKISCSNKLWDYFKDEDMVYAMATIVWWIMYEQHVV